MSAPYRIHRPKTARAAARKPGRRASRPAAAPPLAGDSLGSYLDRLMKMLPAETLSLYLVGAGIIPADAPRGALLGWSILCLAGVIALRIWGTADPQRDQPTDWAHVAISAIAFVLWVYTLGGPFSLYHVHIGYLGSLLVLAWTFFVPLFYKGPAN